MAARVIHGPETRYCLCCGQFGCQHMHLETRYRPPWLNWRQLQLIHALVDEAPANKVMAFEAGLCEGTVKQSLNRASRALRKAGYPVQGRVALVRWAIEHLESVTV